MYVKAVNRGMKSRRSVYEIGEIHRNDYFCNSAYATLEYYEDIENTIYLEVEPIGDPADMGDGCTFQGDMKVLRVIPLQEIFEKEDKFARRYKYVLNSKKVVEQASHSRFVNWLFRRK